MNQLEIDKLMAEWGISQATSWETYPYSPPWQALTFGCIDELRREVTASGSHYFSPDTMRYFKCRIDDTLYQQRFFIQSDLRPCDGGRERVYRVGWVVQHDEGRRLSVERGPFLPSLADARRSVKWLADTLKTQAK